MLDELFHAKMLDNLDELSDEQLAKLAGAAVRLYVRRKLRRSLPDDRGARDALAGDAMASLIEDAGLADVPPVSTPTVSAAPIIEQVRTDGARGAGERSRG